MLVFGDNNCIVNARFDVSCADSANLQALSLMCVVHRHNPTTLDVYGGEEGLAIYASNVHGEKTSFHRVNYIVFGRQ